MGKTESVFAGILLAAVIAAVLMVMFRGDGSDPVRDPGSRWTPDSEQVFAGFSGNNRDDMCTCYEQAFSYADRNLSIESLEYRGGFAECSRRLGQEGSDAWTSGWANGERGSSAPRTCRAWLSNPR